jgi:hypothetical protein
MNKRVLIFLGLLVFVPSMALATVTISAGNHVLLPNTPGQVIDILISTDAADGINALDLYMDVNGGNPAAPVITNYNTQALPTIWGAAATTHSVYGPPYEPPPPTLVFATGVFLNNSASNVPASGILAQLEIDTTGFFPGDGPWPLRLENNDWGETVTGNSSGPLLFVRVDGEISIVPEPSSVVLALFAAAAMGAVVIRRRARKAA